MPDSTDTDYVTKTEAAQIYRRSERSISRDITNALKFTDRRVLQHVELRLEDGTRRPGTKLTIEEIVELRDAGKNPTWLLQTAWLKEHYGRRDEPQPASDPTPIPVTEVSLPSIAQLPDDLELRAAVLAAQNDALRQSNSDLRTQAEHLQKELDVRAEERREENELQKQTNVLMQQVYSMLSTMQESAGQVTFLPAPRPATDVQTYEPATTGVKAIPSQKGTQVSTVKTPTNAAAPRRSKKRNRARKSPPAVQSEQKAAPTTLQKVYRSFFRQ